MFALKVKAYKGGSHHFQNTKINLQKKPYTIFTKFDKRQTQHYGKASS
jgi:hypothetical protein